MPIRFQCGSCSQPIEVDDEWALRAVACPYCRKTVTAPAESTLTDPDQVPMAAPVMTDAPGPDLPSPETFQTASLVGHPNRIALVALILAGSSIGLLIITQLVLAPHRAELEEMQNAIMSANSLADKTVVQSEFFEAHPDMLRWLIPTFMLVIVSGLMSVGAIVCGLIAVRRPQRRGLALAALAAAGLVPIFFCCGGLAFGPPG